MPTGYQGYAGYGDPERAKVDRARQMAELLSQGATDTSPKSFWEGAAQLGKAFIARDAMGKADQAESAYANTVNDRNSRLIAALMPDTPAGRGFNPETQDTFETPATVNPNRQILEALMQQGGSIGDAVALKGALEPKPKEYGFSTVNGGLVRTDSSTGDAGFVIDPIAKPDAPEVNTFGQSWDGEKWVTVPGALENYSRMHPREPRQSDGNGAPPSGYRWNPDGSLSKIPGGPADKPEPSLYTPTEQKNFRAKSQALGTLKHLTDQYRSLVTQYGPGLWDGKLQDGEWKKTPEGQKLLAAHNNLMMYLKGPEMFALGVLTGPDVERLQRTLPEPVGLGAFGQSKETLGIGLDSIDQLVNYQLTNIPEEYRMTGASDKGDQQNPLLNALGTVGRGIMRGLMPQQPPQGRPMQPARPVAPAAVPAGVDPADWQFMTPEQKALFQ